VNFEYKIINYSDFLSGKDTSHDLNIEESLESEKDKNDIQSTEKKLNELGKEGWELVAIINNKFFLKRVVSQDYRY
tara:strand:+ start:2825 stop:3052 length:228 start_codon:yes stop_codon:yes gene_type:complete